MLAAEKDDVSNIHRRWSFTRITPSTLRASFAMMLACAATTVIVSHVFLLLTDAKVLTLHLPIGLAALVGLTFLDFVMLKGTPVNKLSKVVHVSSFALLLWALTVLVGIMANAVFAKQSTDYIVAGMMLAAGLRMGIFVSVFGAGLIRAIAICMVQPVLFFVSFVPPSSYDILAGPVGLGFGSLFVTLAMVWTVIADRAGRPHIPSTFRLLQAFLSAWTENKTGGIEEYFESRAHEESVSTKAIRFSDKTALVIPEVHPGPFSSVGGSNLPYVLNEAFAKKALVMHGVSDHSFNIPSKKEVDRYLISLAKLQVLDRGDECREPVQHRQGNATATAIAFGRTALVLLSLAPKGMEDVPQSIRSELESHAANLGMSLIVVDCHNAMGKQLEDADRNDLVAAAKSCLDRLETKGRHKFAAGFATLSDVSHNIGTGEIGQAGLGVLAIGVANETYTFGWADSNNMENCLRDKIVAASQNIKMLEVCTSDTHSTSGKRTKEGYFALGSSSDQDEIASAYAKMCQKAAARAGPCTFEVLSATSNIKVMGKKQFEDYSAALDRSMNLTKVFVGITFAAFVAMQALAL